MHTLIDMTSLNQGAYAGATIAMVESLLSEFLGDARDQVRALDATLAPRGDLEALRRFAFETKGQAHNFGLSLLEALAHRMEDYISAIPALDERAVAELQAFLEAIGDILDGTTPPDADPALLVRSLPALPAGFSVEEVEIRDVEVMLVMQHGAQTHFIERELHNCGYRVSIVTSTFAALEQTVTTRPDMVIVSAVMPGLSGIDLAVALSHMPETRNIPLALITSLPPGDEQLKLLPDKVPIIRKSDSFGDDLVEALSYHFLL